MRRSSLFWGFVLVILGALLLADNMGIFAINFWQLVWPVLLIAAGLWVLIGVARGWDETDVEHISIPLEGAEAARVVIHHGAGSVKLRGTTAPGTLMAGDFTALKYSLRREGAVDHLRLAMDESSFSMFAFPWAGKMGWQFGLTPDVPINLHVDGGAGALDLDLRGMRVTEMTMDGSVGTTQLITPGSAGFTRVKLEGGVGSTTVRIPDGVAAQIQTEAGLGSINVNETRFPKIGDHFYRSANYDTAENKVEIKIDGGVGSVRIN